MFSLFIIKELVKTKLTTIRVTARVVIKEETVTSTSTTADPKLVSTVCHLTLTQNSKLRFYVPHVLPLDYMFICISGWILR